MSHPNPDTHDTPTLPPPAGDLTIPAPYRSAAAPQAVPFVFTGRGGEYFGIWIVNLLLTIVTFGIYSAWAKVRRMQYFYRNTSLAGASFDYHGDPRAILKGRLIMFVLFVVYNATLQFAPLIRPCRGSGTGRGDADPAAALAALSRPQHQLVGPALRLRWRPGRRLPRVPAVAVSHHDHALPARPDVAPAPEAIPAPVRPLRRDAVHLRRAGRRLLSRLSAGLRHRHRRRHRARPCSRFRCQIQPRHRSADSVRLLRPGAVRPAVRHGEAAESGVEPHPGRTRIASTAVSPPGGCSSSSSPT